jgi:hypothetical protein
VIVLESVSLAVCLSLVFIFHFSFFILQSLPQQRVPSWWHYCHGLFILLVCFILLHLLLLLLLLLLPLPYFYLGSVAVARAEADLVKSQFVVVSGSQYYTHSLCSHRNICYRQQRLLCPGFYRSTSCCESHAHQFSPSPLTLTPHNSTHAITLSTPISTTTKKNQLARRKRCYDDPAIP